MDNAFDSPKAHIIQAAPLRGMDTSRNRQKEMEIHSPPSPIVF